MNVTPSGNAPNGWTVKTPGRTIHYAAPTTMIRVSRLMSRTFMIFMGGLPFGVPEKRLSVAGAQVNEWHSGAAESHV